MLSTCAACGTFRFGSQREPCPVCGSVRFWLRTGQHPSDDMLANVTTGELLEPSVNELPPAGEQMRKVVEKVEKGREQ